MNFNNKKRLVIGLILFMLVFSGFVYHVYAIEELNQEIQETHEVVEELQEDNINYSDQIKSKSKELNELESEYRHMGDKLETTSEQLEEKNKEIKNKQEEIKKLNEDLEAKLQKEEVERALVETEKETEKSKKEEVVTEKPKKSEPTVDAENNTKDKSEILSEDKVAKSEQSNDNEAKTSSSESKNTNIGTFDVTYYSAYDGSQIGITRGGTNMANGNIHTSDGYRVIAVDPNTIPFGSIVRVTVSNGQSFLARADDTGGAIKGNKIDIAVSTPEEAFKLGRATATIELVE